jgi:hypothetical protein
MGRCGVTRCINEFVAKNGAGLQDEHGAHPDWVELYNAGDQPVDLEGWTISDDHGEPDKHQLQGLVIEPQGWLVLFADDGEQAGARHLSFALDADGEELGLYNAAGGLIDQLDYPALQVDQAAARMIDGGNDWTLTDSPTPGSSNESAP